LGKHKSLKQLNKGFPPIQFQVGFPGGSRLFSPGNAPGNISGALNPRVQSLRDEFTGGIRGLLGSARGELVDARVNPLIRRLSGLPGQQRRDLARRNVFGSISQNQVAATEGDVAQRISEARTLATQDALTQEANLLQSLRAAGQDQLAQELSLLGLSVSAIQTIVGSQVSTGATTTTPNQGQGIGNLLFGVGSLLGGIGDLR